jgi:hypothetical protein
MKGVNRKKSTTSICGEKEIKVSCGHELKKLDWGSALLR